MKKLFLILLMAISVVGYSQTWTAKPGVSVASYSNGFYEYLPAGYDGVKKFPLIVFMHGVGETGNGTTALANITATGLPMLCANGEFKRSFIVICPQTTGWSSGDQINQAIDYAVKNYAVDQSRIYVTGLSMGGGAVWDFAQKKGNRAAAILPICGALGANAAGIDSLVKFGLPIWAHHAKDDPTVSVANTNGWVDGVNAKGIKPVAIKTIYPTPEFQISGHGIWNPIYRNPAIYDWFLTYQRGVAPIDTPVVVPPVAFTPIRVAAGSLAGWTSDRPYLTMLSGSAGNKAIGIWGFNPAIAGTTTPELYQTENFGVMEYRFKVPPGDYTVNLYMAELYWNDAAKRLFHVDAEGIRVITSLDVWSAAGGRFKALQRSFNVTVTDGTLNVNFVKGAADNPKVSGIEVVQRGTIVIPPAPWVVTVEYRDSATNALIRAKTDTFAAPVTVVVKQ